MSRANWTGFGDEPEWDDLLCRTFLHLPGIGPATEAELWSRGIRSWEALRAETAAKQRPADRHGLLEREIVRSIEARESRDVGFFAGRLPASEHWRLYPSFPRATVFLDIETTGLSPYEGIVTVVTAHGGGATRSFVADDDLEELPAYLSRFHILVTFNGSLFDVPFLEVRFPAWVPPAAHIDLRFLLRRLGYTGGLKRIEQLLGLGSRDGVEGIHGIDAVRLWEAYRAGSAGALDRLVRYNRADTVNLEPLLEFGVREMRRRVFRPPRDREVPPGAGPPSRSLVRGPG